MLKNAMLYKEELKRAFYEVWYDPKYQYYFGSEFRWTIELSDSSGGSQPRRDFVSVDKEGNLIGYIGYAFHSCVGLADSFGAINFTDDKWTFSRDLKQVIDDIFMKFGMRTLEFCVICGNPIEKSYDKIVQKIGGDILCVRHARAKDLAGNILDDKMYEITREAYLNYKK